MRQAGEGLPTWLTPVLVAPASGPMTPPPDPSDPLWQPIEMGQQWGRTHGTSWLMTTLRVASPDEPSKVEDASPPLLQQSVVLQLHWTTPGDDSLLLRLEATVFLDGRAIGAFDWRHPQLLLPEQACDGEPHTLLLQVYTRTPLPFGGLSLRPRYQSVWQLYHLMSTTLDAALTFSEHDIVRHTLLERLNASYNQLDLREGWHSERFRASAQSELASLQAHLTDGLSSGNRPNITISGHAHLDLAWQWPYWRTRQKITHTVSTVLNLMERYPNYHYSQSQPQALQWVKEDHPELYARLQERAAEGRFEPVGAMWVEADCNLTSGESLVRQIVHGVRFTQQEFGITPRHIWLPDVFGYSAALPQIMRGCDIPVFMTTKISWNQFNRMPCDTFRWRGIDGSEVLTHFVTAPDAGAAQYYTYNGPLRPADLPGTWTNYRQQNINDSLLYLAGWGDGGGGPTEDMQERMRTLEQLPGLPIAHWGRADQFFESLYERVWDQPQLPSWVGELYLEYHRGTYTSQARTKQGNRRAELFYREVELLNSWASLYGMPSRQQQLNEGWRAILLNQFHDVLPGSSIAEVYEDAQRIYAEAHALGEGIRAEALAVLRTHFGWGEQETVLLNTLPWERTDPVQIKGAGGHLSGSQLTTDWDGRPVELLDGVTMPSCGARVLYQREDVADSCHITHTEDGTLLMSNGYYELSVNPQGEMSRLYDKRAERDVFLPEQAGNQLITYEDRPLTFDAWDIDIFYEEKPYPLREAERVEVLEGGPVRVTVEVERRFLSSRITQRISLWRSSPRIDIATEIDWHEHQILLKAAFPVAINSALATYEIQFGSVQRPTHRNTSWDMARFEVCAHRWVDLSEGGYGVSLLNDSKYGHDIHDNVLRLTLLKSGVEPDPTADQGLHRFTYSLLPHQGDWRAAETVRRAYELNAPILSIAGQGGEGAAQGMREPLVSFVSTDCPHVVVETVKPAEDSDGLIVRLYEAHNQRGSGSITFASPIVSAQECNLLEEPAGDVAWQDSTLHFQVRPFEIKTFRVHLAPAR